VQKFKKSFFGEDDNDKVVIEIRIGDKPEGVSPSIATKSIKHNES
jgi:hypothetical protein